MSPTNRTSREQAGEVASSEVYAAPMSPAELMEQLSKQLEKTQFPGVSGPAAMTLWRAPRTTNDWPMTSFQFSELIGADAEEDWLTAKPIGEFMGPVTDGDEDAAPEALENARRLIALSELMIAQLYSVRVYRRVTDKSERPFKVECFAVGRHDSGEVIGFHTTMEDYLDDELFELVEDDPGDEGDED